MNGSGMSPESVELSIGWGTACVVMRKLGEVGVGGVGVAVVERAGNEDGGKVFVNGARERRRIACVIVGWKRPPWGECARRWVGRVWPREKNVARALWTLRLGPFFEAIPCVLLVVRSGSGLLVLKHYVMTPQGPAHVVWRKQNAQWQCAPHSWVIEAAAEFCFSKAHRRV